MEQGPIGMESIARFVILSVSEGSRWTPRSLTQLRMTIGTDRLSSPDKLMATCWDQSCLPPSPQLSALLSTLKPGRLQPVVERLWTAGHDALLHHHQRSNRLRPSTDNPYQPLPAVLIGRLHWSLCHRVPGAKCPALAIQPLNHFR